MTTTEITQLPENQKLEFIAEGNFGGAIFLKETFSFQNFDVMIVKVQWTKTQKVYALRVENYFTGRDHLLQAPVSSLREANYIIKNLIENDGNWFFPMVGEVDFGKHIA